MPTEQTTQTVPQGSHLLKFLVAYRLSPMADLYLCEDAQQILQIAIAKDTETGEISRQQLEEIATELNIAPETLWSAEQEWLALNTLSAQQQQFNQHKRQRFHHHLIRYGIVNGFLLLLNLLAVGGIGTALFIATLWGIPLALHGWRAYQTSGFRYQKDFDKWSRRQQIRQSVSSFVNRLLSA